MMTGIVHLQDSRRPVACSRKGAPRQVPVICELDILDVHRLSESWSSKLDLVTCERCRSRIEGRI